MAISLLHRSEAGPSSSKQASHWALLNSLTALEDQIKTTKSIAKLEVESKVKLDIKVSSLECQLESYNKKIQEMNLALAVKESLYEQGLKKHQEMVTQNTELQKQLEVTIREGRIQ